ncbi:unnamed protein product [Zymoseptoria tritici ST99CH_3D1]|nr:unnamed protein product [Zymoseptoria tritici ST99CH_3D1]
MSTVAWRGLDIDTCVGLLKSVRLAALRKIRSTSGVTASLLRSKLERLGLLLDAIDFAQPTRPFLQTLLDLLGLLLDRLEDLILEAIRTSVQDGSTATMTKLALLASLMSEKGEAEAAESLDLEPLQDAQRADDVLDTLHSFLEALERCPRATVDPQAFTPSDSADSVGLQDSGDAWRILFDLLSKRIVECSSQHEVHQTRLFLGSLADQVDALRLLCSGSNSQKWYAVDFLFKTSNRTITQGSLSSACELCNVLSKSPKHRATEIFYDKEKIWHVDRGMVLEPSRRDPQLQSLQAWLLAQPAHRYRKALQCILAQWLNCLYGTPWLPESYDLDSVCIDGNLAKDGYRTPYVKCRSWQPSECPQDGIPDAAFMIRFGILMLRIEFPGVIEPLIIEGEDTLDAEELDELLQDLLEDERICENLEVRMRSVLEVCQNWDAASLPERRVILEKIVAPLLEELRFRFELDVPDVPDRTVVAQAGSQAMPSIFGINGSGQVSVCLLNKAPPLSPMLLYDDHDDPADAPNVKYAHEFFAKFAEFRRLHVAGSQIQKRVKIAVIDTGINEKSPSVHGHLFRIKQERNKLHEEALRMGPIVAKQSFVGGDGCVNDAYGHGTRVLSLLLRTAPDADFYIAKISTRANDDDAASADHIIQALDWAMAHEVDLINMSFGFTRQPEDGRLQQKFRDVHAKGIKMFAAAANHGRNGPRSFPASAHEVICVNASSGQGVWIGNLNPSATGHADKWNTLGTGIEFIEASKKTYKSGTSYATPLAVGIVANAIDVMRYLQHQNLLSSNRANYFQTYQGVEELMKMMSTDGFLAHWTLWNGNDITPSGLAARLEWQSR